MKKLLTMFLSVVMVLSMSLSAFAAGWQKDNTGWWYGTNADNSTWYSNGWQWIDGNQDGTAECYYFDANGYMLANTTTPDGYQVNSDGAWVQNGVIQTQTGTPTNQQATSNTITGTYNMTYDGKSYENPYHSPINDTDITAINNPEEFCRIMNSVYSNANFWKVDSTKPVVNSGSSNIRFKVVGGDYDIKNSYAIIRTSDNTRNPDDPSGKTFGLGFHEVRVYCFDENGYMLVNTTKNGIYFNERGEAVIDGKVVQHTNHCFYGDDGWRTTLADKQTFHLTLEQIEYNNLPIFMHTWYTRIGDANPTHEVGFGSCCR